MARLPCYPSPLLPLNAYLAILLTASGYLTRSLYARHSGSETRAEQEHKSIEACASRILSARTHLQSYERLIRQNIPAEELRLPAGQQAFQFDQKDVLRAYQQMRSEAYADSLQLATTILTTSPQCFLPRPLKAEGRQALLTLRQFARGAALAPSFELRLSDLFNGIDAAAITFTLFSRQLQAASRKTGPLK